MRPRRAGIHLSLALGATALWTGCAAEAPPVHRGPIVLITIDALRADLVGTGLLPNLDRLAVEADWAGTAITTSSWTVPSMASLFTGQQPLASRQLAQRPRPPARRRADPARDPP